MKRWRRIKLIMRRVRIKIIRRKRRKKKGEEEKKMEDNYNEMEQTKSEKKTEVE